MARVKCGSREKDVILAVVNIDTGNNMFVVGMFKVLELKKKQINEITVN